MSRFSTCSVAAAAFMLVPAGAFAAGDTDGDGLPDEWEILNFGDLDENEIGDLEPDGLTNIQEFNRNTDPNDADSDDDGIDDGPEFNIHRTDPADADSDDDGLSDGMELGTYNTDPLADDSDNDGLSDGAEINTHSTSPRLEDSDGDGFNDGMEISAGSDPVDPGSRPDFSNLSNVVINEFMAQNRSTLLDEDGESSDWIELWNPNHQPVPITGWYLTDDPDDLTKWTFPVHTMDGNSFLLLFASTKDRTVSGNELHTSFALEKRGGFLALTRPAGQGEVEIVHQFNPYAAQTEDVSFGLYGNDEPLQSGFFLTPTPDAANDPGAVQGFVADTRFSVDRGFYDTPQSVVISSVTPGASIIYTTNSTVPTLTPLNGVRVDAPDANTPPGAMVTISRTTVLRAFAFKDDHEPTNVDTQTYVFADQVLQQSTPSQSWANWGNPGPDWDMDTLVTEHSNLSSRCVADDLLEIPTLSISLPFADMWGNRGIYISGEGVERDCSIEFINPDGDPANPNSEQGFQIDGTVQIVGGSSTGRWKSNHLSMRVKFTNGDLRHKVFAKPWIPFGNEATDRFDTLVVDGRLNNVWNHPSHSQRVLGQYVRDQYVADLQNALGGTAPHGRHMHVYVAGIYWGMHTIHERPDDNFAAEYFGGNNDDYDVVKHSGSTVISGSSTNYNRLSSVLNADLSNQGHFQRATSMLDLEDFAKYMIVNYFCGNTDWDQHNWYASFNRRVRGARWHFHSWDAEHVLKGENDDATGRNNSGKPTGFQHRLMANEDYKLIFADIVRREFFHGGELSPSRAIAHYSRRLNIIDRAIRAESARWGDSKRPGQPYTRGNEWLAERNRIVRGYLRRRTNTVFRQFQDRGWYPATDAPDFSPHGGNVTQDFALSITSPDGGTIYYTMDGNDPRENLTGTPLGTAYTGPVTLSSTGVLKARVRSNGGEWSALTEALFAVGTEEAGADNLVVSEVHYRPGSPSAEEITAGYNNRGDFEFIELLNVSPTSIDLSDAVFENGIDFNFRSDSEILALDPGERILIVKNAAAFEFRYGTGLPVAGVFQNGTDLSNGGENITLSNDTTGETIQDFAYSDTSPWTEAADGHGYSLTLACPAAGAHLTDPLNWRASREVGGTPGGEDRISLADWLSTHGLAAGQEESDLDRDGLSALLEYAVGGDPNDSSDGNVFLPAVASLEVDEQTDNYLVLQFPRLKGADDVRVTAEVSADLITWSDAGPVVDYQFSSGNLVEVLMVRAPIPAGSEAQFIRLRVESR